MATFTKVNTAHANGGSGTLANLTIPASTVGNLGILAISADGGTGSLTYLTTGGGAWTNVATKQYDSTNTQDAVFQWVIFTSSVTNLAMGGSSSMNGAAVVYCEFHCDVGFAASPFDVGDMAKAFFSSSNTTDANTSNNVTVASTPELLIGVGSDDSGNAPTWTAGTGWSMGVAEPGSSGLTGACFIEWKTASSGSQNATSRRLRTGIA